MFLPVFLEPGKNNPAGGKKTPQSTPMNPHVTINVFLYVDGRAAIVGANTPTKDEIVLTNTLVILTLVGGTLSSRIK